MRMQYMKGKVGMEHFQWFGTAYEVGFQRGMALREKGLFAPNRIQAQLHPQRLVYGAKCAAMTQAYDPSLNAEIHGLSDALGFPYDQLCAFLFGMYAFTADAFCTCVALHDQGGTWLGRNSDFLKEMAPYVIHERINDQYWGNTSAFIELEDGRNDNGLAIGLTYVRPHRITCGYHGGMMIRHLLKYCRDVDMAVRECRRLPIGSSFTLIMADRFHHLAYLECCCDHVALRRDDRIVYGVNHFYLDTMKEYRLRADLSDLHSDERLETIRHWVHQYPKQDEQLLRGLLKGAYGFMCQYPAHCPADTLWSVLYRCDEDDTSLCVGNPQRCAYKRIPVE